jgi:hypothetical protein
MLLVWMVVHPSENFNTAPGAAVAEKRSRVFLADLDYSIIGDRDVTEAVHVLGEPQPQPPRHRTKLATLASGQCLACASVRECPLALS